MEAQELLLILSFYTKTIPIWNSNFRLFGPPKIKMIQVKFTKITKPTFYITRQLMYKTLLEIVDNNILIFLLGECKSKFVLVILVTTK